MPEIQEEVLRVKLEKFLDLSYDIVIGSNLFPQIARDLKTGGFAAAYAIITDSNVEAAGHSDRLEKAILSEGLKVKTFPFPAGEQNKRLVHYESLANRMAEENFGRDSSILALGGGVVGDLAGFLAGTYNRGIPFIQIPTTVLSQADSAVGGKTGVDTIRRKNLLGVFNQPLRVYIDVDTLQTLHQLEYVEGLAETIKHAVIADSNFFEFLESNMKDILLRTPESSFDLARYNCKIKREVVQLDPDEKKGIRRILNYGHTVGQAVETLANYEFSHGRCVSRGMMVAARISRDLGYMTDNEVERLEKLSTDALLPVNLPSNITNKAIIEQTRRDAKAKDGNSRYCLPKKIGEMNDFGGAYVTPVPDDVVIKALNETR